MVFGDLFLEDIRNYREELFNRIGMRPLFPLWKRDTTALIKSFITRGFKAVVTCVDSKALDSSFAGRLIDSEFLSQLQAA
jgi:diphthamide synthase (EF-2-diphthine--ammonia ligase)